VIGLRGIPIIWITQSEYGKLSESTVPTCLSIQTVCTYIDVIYPLIYSNTYLSLHETVPLIYIGEITIIMKYFGKH